MMTSRTEGLRKKWGKQGGETDNPAEKLTKQLT